MLSDLTDSWGGEPASQSTLDAPYRMKVLDTFHPILDTGETAPPRLGCSAHYFEIEGSTLGAAGTGSACGCSTSATRATCARSATTA